MTLQAGSRRGPSRSPAGTTHRLGDFPSPAAACTTKRVRLCPPCSFPSLWQHPGAPAAKLDMKLCACKWSGTEPQGICFLFQQSRALILAFCRTLLLSLCAQCPVFVRMLPSTFLGQLTGASLSLRCPSRLPCMMHDCISLTPFWQAKSDLFDRSVLHRSVQQHSKRCISVYHSPPLPSYEGASLPAY